MINVENRLFTAVYEAVKAEFPGADIKSTEEPNQDSFPAVVFSEKGNATATRYSTQNSIEEYAEVWFECQVYSNKKSGAKSEAKAVINIIDLTLQRLGLIRTYTRQLLNVRDTSIVRYVARWRAVTDGKTFYRR